MTSHFGPHRDRGSVLPLVLVVTVVLSLVIAALATYASSGLRYNRVVEARAARLAAADGGIRYAVEKLRLQQSACTTALGNSGILSGFNSSGGGINGADVEVMCERLPGSAGDTQGWALVVTGGEHGDGALTTQSGHAKKIGGPVFAHRAATISGDIVVENADVWYGATSCPSAAPLGVDYYPVGGVHGSICTTQPWDSLFTPPLPNVPTTAAADPNPIDFDGPGPLGTCVILSPGKYSAPLTLAGGSEYYFRSGEYYFENAELRVEASTVVAGYADGTLGDVQSLTSNWCKDAQDIDRTDGGDPGATFYLGGSSSILVYKGQLEIMRRLQDHRAVSIQALDISGPGFLRSSRGIAESDYIVKVDNPGNAGLAMHGLMWAPNAYAELKVLGQASGVALGGLVVGAVFLKSSASSDLVIRVETSPMTSQLRLTSTATLDGGSTSIRAIAQVRPDNGDLVLNSWRVCDPSSC